MALPILAEPISSSAATATLVSVALLSILPGIDASHLLGAATGAAIYLLAHHGLSLLRIAASFLVAFIAGLLAADLAANLLASLLPTQLQVSPAVGAMLAAALGVKLLQGLIDRAGSGSIRDLLKPGSKPEGPK